MSANLETPSGRINRGLLVLQAMPRDLYEIGPESVVLGLPFALRVVKAAIRAGFERIVVLTDDIAATREILDGTPAVVLANGDPVPTYGLTRAVVLAGNVLPSQNWLRGLLHRRLEAGQMDIRKDTVAVIRTEPDRQFLPAPLPSGPQKRSSATPGSFESLECSFQARESTLTDDRTLVLTPNTTKAEINAHLIAGLVKQTDGFMSRHVARPISLALTRRLAATPVSANAMTVVSILIGLLSAPFFLSSAPEIQVIGGLLFVLHSIVDGCDGELARLRFTESRFGGLLDYWGDNLVHIAVFASMAVGWSSDLGAFWPLWLGAAAVAGTAASAGLVYWRTMRTAATPGPVFTTVARVQGSRLAKMADTLARRDFIYLVAILSAFGKAAWFLALTAVGAPLFFFILLVIARAETKTGNLGAEND